MSLVHSQQTETKEAEGCRIPRRWRVFERARTQATIVGLPRLRPNLVILAFLACFTPTPGAPLFAQERAVDFYRRAGQEYDNRQWDAALSNYSRTIDLAPKYADAYIGRGNVKEVKGDLDGALADYTRAATLDTKSATAYYNQGVVQRKKGNLDAALAAFSQTIGLSPRDASAYHQRGRVKIDKGDFAGASADLDRAILFKPKNAQLYLDSVIAKREQRDWDGVIAAYTRLISLQPTTANYYQERSAARRNKGDLDGALSDSTRAIELEPQTAYRFSLRGKLKVDKGDLGGALADFNRAIELDPTNTVSARLDLIWLNVGRTNLPAALAECDRIIQLNHENCLAYAYQCRGDMKYHTGDLPGALADYRRATEQRYSFGETLISVWLVRSQLGEKTAADEELSAWLVKHTENEQERLTVKTMQFLQGKTSQTEVLAAVSSEEPRGTLERCWIFYVAGKKHLLEGDKEAARADFRKCLGIKRRSPPACCAQLELNALEKQR